jgi:hypothetical protein
METKKIISVVILFCIISISLIFSVLLTQNHVENFANPSASDITGISNILNDSTIDTFTKIQQIYPIARNNSIFSSMYNNISISYISAITKYIKNVPIVDSNGTPVDKNSISQANIEQINGILYNKKNAKMTSFEKISAMKQYICNNTNSCDSRLKTIFTSYMKTWIDLITNYVNKLQSPKNLNVAKSFAQF